jgi:hypothetical protein
MPFRKCLLKDNGFRRFRQISVQDDDVIMELSKLGQCIA